MTQISKIETYDSKPKVTTMGKFVRSTMDPNNKNAQQVKKYRETGQDRLKNTLPAVTFGCLLTGERDEQKYEKPGRGYRKKEQIKKYTAWTALDIDASDNPHLKDAEAVRDAVGKFPFVAFSGLSASATGVWALVKIEDPQKQARHFEQLESDFKHYGITLDSTKGKNPHDLRYYSFDPGAYVADDFEIYDRLPKEKTENFSDSKTTESVDSKSFKLNNSDKYAEAALNDEIEKLCRTANGNRNNQLFKSTASLAELVAGNVLNKNEVRSALFDAALSTGLKKAEIKKTINSGFRTGMENPRQPSNNGHARTLKREANGLKDECKTKNIKQNKEQPKDFNLPAEDFKDQYGSYPTAPF